MKQFWQILTAVFLLVRVATVTAGFNFDGKNSTINLKSNSSKLVLYDQIPNFSGRLKLYDDTSSRITSDSAGYDVIIFQDGVVDTGGGDFAFTGTFIPGSGGYNLSSGGVVNSTGSTLARPLTVASGASTELKGLPTLNGAVTLTDSTSSLKIGLNGKMTENIVLNSGTVQLTDDLRFKDTKSFTGNGTVDVNNRALFRSGGSASTATVTYLNARDIQFGDNQALNGGTEIYSGDGTYSLINGNGYTWTLSNAGQIQVGANHTLYLTDMRIKGLGPTGGTSGYLNLDATAVVVLSNVTLDLGGNYTHNSGIIRVQGDNCKIIHHDYSFTITGANAQLAIDGVALLYEPLSGSKNSPFVFGNQSLNLAITNGGVIRTAEGGGSGGGTGETAVTINSTPYTLTANLRATSTSTISFSNGDPETAAPMTLDGSGYYIQFPSTSTSGLFALDPNVQLTFTNVILKDFDPAAITYGDASSKIIFGDNCRIQLAKNVVIGSSDRAWEFVLTSANSTAYVDAMGHSITLNAATKLTLDGAGADAGKVVFENCRLATNVSNSLSCLHYNGVFEFSNSSLVMGQSGMAFNLGSMLFSGKSALAGTNPATSGGSSTFTLSTTGTLTVASQATLEIAPGTTFVYQATPTPGATPSATTYAQSKRHFTCADPSATLIFNACDLQSTSTGLAFDYGKLLIFNKVNWTASTNSGAEMELGTAVDLSIMGGALLSVDGPIKYVASSYP